MDQIDKREITWDSFSEGMMRFLYGFNKKMLLSNLLANVADTAFGAKDLSVAMAWLGAVTYSLQIYFDFSGYSEMAIGLGRIFGFKFLENFDYPYISKTVSEFWRRWHISLGSWFRDYVYFPLGGSRVKTKARLIFNLSVVWLATGIWHGASWHYVAWGVLHGAVIIVEKTFELPRRLSDKKILTGCYRIGVLLVIVLGWVLFRANGLLNGLTYLKNMFGLKGNAFVDDSFLFNIREYGVILAAGLICSTPLLRICGEKIQSIGEGWRELWDFGRGVFQMLLFIVSISFLVMNAHNPFIYFNF